MLISGHYVSSVVHDENTSQAPETRNEAPRKDFLNFASRMQRKIVSRVLQSNSAAAAAE